MNNTYTELSTRILAEDGIVILPHVNMDGDALGSSSALCIALRKLGKRAAVLCSENIPGYLDFLEMGCVIGDTAEFGEVGLVLMVDCGAMNRIPGREDVLRAAPVKGIIDHHGVLESDIEFDFGRIEPDSAAAGEMIYLLIREMGCGIDLSIANCLYAAISSDTGNYQYSNTTARSHEITAELHRTPGFDPKKISVLLYERRSFDSLRLESMMVNTINVYAGGKVAIGRVTQEMLEDTCCEMSESEGFIQKILGVKGVEIACLLKETAGIGTRVSLRAKSYSDVAEVALKFGGGGHVKAAGCTLHCDPDDAEELICPALIEAALKQQQIVIDR